VNVDDRALVSSDQCGLIFRFNPHAIGAARLWKGWILKQCLIGLWVCFHGCLEGIGVLKLREGLIVSMEAQQ